MNRRTFLELSLGATSGALMAACGDGGTPSPPPDQLQTFSFLGWDTEGTGKETKNLLRAPISIDGRVDGLTFIVRAASEIRIPLDVHQTPTTIIPSTWTADGIGLAPLIISAPDHGQMLLAAAGVRARLEGTRFYDDGHQTVDLILEVPAAMTFTLQPVYLPSPIADTALWNKIRRGYFNAFTPASKWTTDASQGVQAPAGVHGSNVVSDVVSFSLMFAADAALLVPELAPGISYMTTIRRSLEYWLDQRMLASGEVYGYWNYHNFLDANPSLLIAAWDYIEATGDLGWLSSRIAQLEQLSAFLASRDVDSDGLVEAAQSGNDFTLGESAPYQRSSSWWDAVNSGYKDAYANAYIYRAWRCLADLESKLQRTAWQAKYNALADALKAAYAPKLMAPSGWLAWWRSADGQLHDRAAVLVNSLAIAFGLVDAPSGKKLLSLMENKLAAVGFLRPELGIPSNLESFSDGEQFIGRPFPFQQYENGGISAGHTLPFLMAHYLLGSAVRADGILTAMIDHQNSRGFQQGVGVGNGNKTIDWTDWSGQPGGYEGFISDVYAFTQAVLLRDPAHRAKLYRPL